MLNTQPMMDDPMAAAMGGQPMQGQMGGMMPPQEGPEGQEPMGEMGQDPEEGMETSLKNQLDAALANTNLAKKLEKKKDKDGNLVLDRISSELLAGVEADKRSRQWWIDANKEWLNLALLVREGKTFPWAGAANVKYPLLATAAMQFSARAYPALVPSDNAVVKTRVTQGNAGQAVYDAAQRVSRHMSFQLFNRVPNWEEQMDKLLMTIAISGLCFKETYSKDDEGCHRSDLVYPEDLIVNYYTTDIDSAYRKTRVLKYTRNEIEEKVRNDQFLEVEYGDPVQADQDEGKQPLTPDGQQPSAGKMDSAAPHIFYAVHTFWDLDEDGYEEPYIITIHKATQKVVRIIARWDSDGIKMDEKGKKVISIKPIEYFTAYPFIPNPDGSIYALGFGFLLGPINETVNTLINQLVDSGTINNLQSGFIAKGLRVKIGDSVMRPGEWRVVNATGDDLKGGIFPMPSKEPSSTLFQLLNLMITSGNQLASIAEIMVGKMPGQNTPATTTQEAVQQGMAVFTAIYKRVYRSLAQEFKKLFRLNRICPDIVEEESKISGIQLQTSDYDLDDWAIMPGADPTGDSQTVRLNKYQIVGQQLAPTGFINMQEYAMRMLKDLEIPDAQSLVQQPQPAPPDPKVETEKMKQQTMQMKAETDSQSKQQELQIKERMAALEEQGKQMQLNYEKQKQALDAQGQQQEFFMKQMEQRYGLQMKSQEVAQASEAHALAMQREQQNHVQQMQHKEQAASQQSKKPAAKGGKKRR